MKSYREKLKISFKVNKKVNFLDNKIEKVSVCMTYFLRYFQLETLNSPMFSDDIKGWPQPETWKLNLMKTYRES